MRIHSDVIASLKHASRTIWIDVESEGTEWAICLRGKDRILAGNKPSEAQSEKDRASAIPLLCWNAEDASTRRFAIATFENRDDAELVGAQLLAFYDTEPTSRGKIVITIHNRPESAEQLADMRQALTDFDSIVGVTDARARLKNYDERFAALNSDAQAIVTALLPVYGIAPTAEQVQFGIGTYADHLAGKVKAPKAAKAIKPERAAKAIADLSALLANKEALAAMQSAMNQGKPEGAAPSLESQLTQLFAQLQANGLKVA